MLSFITLLFCLGEIAFPALMLCLVYPFSKRAALFWSDYITCHCARVVFALLGFYRKFRLLEDKKSLENLPPQFVVISNHQSLFDIVVYLRFFGGKKARFVAKDTLGCVPMVGKMLKSQGHCMIPRHGSPSVAMLSIDSFSGRVLSGGKTPIIFPEGTRTRDGNVGQFYAAGFRRLVEGTSLPVAVCALDGGWQISRLDSLFKNLHRGSYRVKVLKVFPFPSTKDEQKNVLEEARELIKNQLDEWRKLPPSSDAV
ncbi:lysophospholipid acyltransferase family protein [Treponema sp.]|uniref:lysophospholipid acyltransferase family protein n=1 Tax=Treponema sp. TaxID=166 RepID=UPI003F0697F8